MAGKDFDCHPAFDQYRRVNDVARIGPIRRTLCAFGGMGTAGLALVMFSLVLEPNLVDGGRLVALIATGALVVPATVLFIRAIRGK